jgi:hypothetical protein
MSLNISINLQHGVKTNTTLAVSSCPLTECKHKRHFAYTSILKKPPNFDENCLRQGLGRFSDEMRSNRMHVESQQVTAAVLRQKVSNGKW